MELAGGPSLSPPDLGGRGRQRESGGDPHSLEQRRGTQAEEELRGGGQAWTLRARQPLLPLPPTLGLGFQKGSSAKHP